VLHWSPADLDALLFKLRDEGFRVIGPSVRDGAIVYADLDALPVGVGDDQEAGRYRLRERGDQARFGYNLGPSSFKQYLFPSREELFAYADGNIVPAPLDDEKLAFIGVRACELAAIQVLDRVFAGDGFKDRRYQARRRNLLMIAVDCSQSAPTCFCASSGDGPGVGEGADLVLTELLDDGEPSYAVRAGSDRGAELLAASEAKTAPPDLEERVRAVVEETREGLARSLPREGLRDALLGALNHPHWQEVADRCLACGNCTQVCPTCFCSTAVEETDPVTLRVSHVRQWDSCFTAGHSYVHGGPVHAGIASRYRQWLTHKLASWEDQFGRSGCTGCGRCISWCPVGIDLTAEAEVLRSPA